MTPRILAAAIATSVLLPATVASHVQTTRFTIQVAAFRDQAAAERMLEQLAARGIEGYLEGTPAGIFRVRVGSFESREAARALAARLESEQFATLVTSGGFIPPTGAAAAQESTAPLGADPLPRWEGETFAVGAAVRRAVLLRAGFAYVFTLICMSGDKDLVVRDPEGVAVGESSGGEVLIDPARSSGRYEVEFSCSEDSEWVLFAAPVKHGLLGANESASIPVRLRAGVNYSIRGECGVGCGSLDLRLRDPDRKTAAEAVDELGIQFTNLEFQPQRDGDFTVVVDMNGCLAEPCKWRVWLQVFDEH